MEKQRVKVEGLFRTSQGLASESSVRRDLSLATDPQLERIGLVTLYQRFPFGSYRLKSTFDDRTGEVLFFNKKNT